MKPFKKKIKKFDTAEIMTGGIIPKGFDTIIPIEQIIFAPNKKYILIDQKIKKFDHVRFAGSDYKKGEVVIKKNTIVQPNHILAFKSLGIKQIKVKKKINILFFSTGNEISNKDNIPNWMVRNSNTHYIKNLNQNFLFNFKSGSILRDNHQNIFKQKIYKLIKSKDDIIIDNPIPHIKLVPHKWRKLKTRNSERCIPLIGASLWASFFVFWEGAETSVSFDAPEARFVLGKEAISSDTRLRVSFSP